MTAKLLVCAATLTELSTFLRDDEPGLMNDDAYSIESGAVTLAVTGVGIPCTLLRLPPLLASLKPDLVLNIGIAGAYPNSGLELGAVAMARSEIFGDIGFELPDDPGFRFVGCAPFGAYYRKATMLLAADFRHEPAGNPCAETDACTVNACTGTLRTGLMRERLFSVGMESMEGAAVALACDAAGIPACEVRAISNIAAERNVRSDNVQVALERLRGHLQACRRRQEV